MQMNEKVCKRSACVLLIAVLLLALFSTTIIPAAHSTESGSPGPYGSNIGHTAWFNLDFYSSFLVFTHPADFDYFGTDGEFDFDSSDNDSSDWDNDDYWLNSESFNEDPDISEDHLLVITNVYWDSATTALWYKVEAAPGYELPAKMAQNGYVWVYQNLTEVYSDEYWEEVSPDSLIIDPNDTAEFEKIPESMVSSEGITVSSAYAALTELEISAAEAPVAPYIHRAIAYNMTPKTDAGEYTDYAEITIPIPEDWDSSKVFGFVMEEDGTISAIPGTVTKYGTFRFTVPHFSEVGLFEATAAAEVVGNTVTMTVGESYGAIAVSGTPAVSEGEYLSEDGCVAYSVAKHNQKWVFTLLGADVTDGTQITIGDTTYTVIVKPVSASVNKLLTGTSSVTLDAFYDLAIRGEWYSLAFAETTDEQDVITLDETTGTVSSNGKTGTAVVTATLTHKESENTVATVTYRITTSSRTVTDTKNIHVPKGGTVSVTNLSGAADLTLLDSAVADAEYENGTLSITANGETGQTAVFVGSTLFLIHAEPENLENPEKNVMVYVYVYFDTIQNATAYYAVNGGQLHRIKGQGTLIGLSKGEYNESSDEQPFPDGFNIMFFSAPNEGYATTKYHASGAIDFYSLVDGVLHDGSDSSAWPLDDSNATDVPATSGDSAWVYEHGFRWSLLEGNMTIAQMRDLFTRALALGCDSAITYTKNGDITWGTNLSITAESLATFTKTIARIQKEDGTVITFDEDNPYDGQLLEIGDTVTYQFTVNVETDNITYSNIEIVDSQIGDSITKDTLGKGEHTFTMPYRLKVEDIKKYAHGEFWNSASLSYSYKSTATKGNNATVIQASVKCNISSIITWTDAFGNVWDVDTKTIGETIQKSDCPAVSMDGYTFRGWTIENQSYFSDDASIYEISDTDSITILAQWTPTQYTLTLNPDGGVLAGGGQNQTYTIEDTLTLPTPTREGYTFAGWQVNAGASKGNWSEGEAFSAGAQLKHRYGDVTLTAQWTVNQYTITFDTAGGSTVSPITQNFGTKITAPTNPTKAGYVFVGWLPELPDTMPAENLHVTAQWALGFTSLTIQVDGCQNIDENQTFLFRITGNGTNLTVTVHGNSATTIEDLQIGKTYTVTQLTGWSWRYDAPTVSSESAGISYTPVTGGAEVTITGQNIVITFNQSRKENKWLDGNSWLDNWLQQN